MLSLRGCLRVEENWESKHLKQTHTKACRRVWGFDVEGEGSEASTAGGWAMRLNQEPLVEDTGDHDERPRWQRSARARALDGVAARGAAQHAAQGLRAVDLEVRVRHALRARAPSGSV